MANTNDETTGVQDEGKEQSLPAKKTSINDVRETDVAYRSTPPPRPTSRGIHTRREIPPLPDEQSE